MQINWGISENLRFSRSFLIRRSRRTAISCNVYFRKLTCVDYLLPYTNQENQHLCITKPIHNSCNICVASFSILLGWQRTFFQADPCPTYLYYFNTEHYVINLEKQHALFLYRVYNARRIPSNRLLKPKSRIIMGVLLE